MVVGLLSTLFVLQLSLKSCVGLPRALTPARGNKRGEIQATEIGSGERGSHAAATEMRVSATCERPQRARPASLPDDATALTEGSVHLEPSGALVGLTHGLTD